MTVLFDKLAQYWAYPFVRHAMVVGVLVALCASLLGVTLVLRRFAFLGDGLSHVAFGGMAVASALNLTDNMPLILGVTIVCAVMLLGVGRHAGLRGDAALAMLSAGALAVGYLVMNLASGSSNLAGDVCTTLFGSTSILTLREGEVALSIGLSAALVLLYVLFYHKIFAVTFDERFAAATGMRTRVYNLCFAIVTAVVIVLAMRLVGSLLISALVTFPAMSAMRLFRSFRAVTLCAAALSVCSAAAGLVVAVLAGTPVGATIVTVQIALFAVCALAGVLRQGARGKGWLCLPLLMLVLCTACGGADDAAQAAAAAPDMPKAAQQTPAPPAETPAAEVPADTAETPSAAEGRTPAAQPAAPETPPAGAPVDVDLTQLSASVAFAEVYNMRQNPDGYLGKRLRVAGRFTVNQDPKTGTVSCGLLIEDAAACCSQGMDLLVPASWVYPKDYPALDSRVTLTGELQADEALKARGIVLFRLAKVTFESIVLPK